MTLEKPENDNRGDVDKMLFQQKQLDSIIEDIQESEQALEGLAEFYADAKASIVEYLSENFEKAQLETKKSAGIDVFMLWASNKAGLQKKYRDYVYYSKKASIHTKILESKGRRLSGMQSKIKLNDWRK